MNHSELSHMASAVDDSTINIVVVIIIIIIIIMCESLFCSVSEGFRNWCKCAYRVAQKFHTIFVRFLTNIKY